MVTIEHECVKADEMGDYEIAWRCALDRFRSKEARTVVIIVSQLTRLWFSEGEAIQNFFLRAQELYSRLQQAGEHLFPAIFGVLMLTGLPE